MKAKLLILCFGGFSTSLLIKRFKKNIEPYGYEIECDAEPVEKGLNILKNYDVVILGPQVRYMKAKADEKAAAHGVPVILIPANEYMQENPERLNKEIADALNSLAEKGELKGQIK